MEYKIDYGALPLNPAPRNDNAPLFASIDGRAAALGQDEVVFYDPHGDRSHVMTTQVLQALDVCREFQPMDLHVQRVAAALPNMAQQQVAVRRVLESLAARGLLVSDDAFLRRFEVAKPAPALAPAGIFIRACNRPAQLQRLLDSLVGQFAAHGSLPVHLVDDSTDSEAAKTHERLLSAFGERSAAKTCYIGAARWQAIVDELVSALPEHAAALQALLTRQAKYRGRRGGGIGKNLITLLAAGRPYLLLDDDFVLPLQRHPEYRAGLAFEQRGWAIRSYAALEQAIAAGNAAPQDSLAAHLRLCGRTLAEALGQADGFTLSRQELRGIAPSRCPELRADASIVLTSNGHRGNTGSAGVAWLFLLDAAGRAGFAADEAVYAATRGDVPIWFGVHRYQLGRAGNFTPFAIDNSALMPCTSPFGRGEDALFNALVHVARADALQLDVPEAIGHLQEGRRDRSALLNQAELPDINHCLAEFARHVGEDLYAGDGARRLDVFAARLDDLAHGSDASVIAYLREYLAYRRSLLVEKLQQSMAGAQGVAPGWQVDLRALIEANGRAIIERGVPRFAGWAEDATASDCAAALRAEADVLVAGLRAWPAAWEVALNRREAWLSA